MSTTYARLNDPEARRAQCCPPAEPMDCDQCGVRVCPDTGCAVEGVACLEVRDVWHCTLCRDSCRGCLAEARAEAGCFL